MDKLDRSTTQFQKPGTQVRQVGKLRAQDPDDDLQAGQLLPCQIGGREEALAKNSLDLILALLPPKKGPHLVPSQCEPFPFQQEDGPVAEIPLEEDSQPIQ